MAADSLSPLTPPADRIVEALRAFERAVGGRAQLVEALTHHQDVSDSGEVIMRLLANPENEGRTLASLCAAANLSVGKFLKIFATAKGAAAYLAAMDRVWDDAPEVAADAMKAARTVTRKCPWCRGKGYTKVKKLITNEDPDSYFQGESRMGSKEVVCKACDGQGKHEVIPEVERVKVALQLAGLLKSEPRVTVDQSRHQTNQVVVADSMRAFIAATNRLLYGALPPAPTETEVAVVEVSSTPVEPMEES